MENLRLPTARSNSLIKQGNSSVRQALADRMTLSEALEHVHRLLQGFPNGGANAGDGYIGALAATLGDYPRMVATKCCSPVHGVARETKFLPTVADIVAFCERETTELRRPVDREDHDRKMREEFTRRAEDEKFWAADRAARPSLDEIRAKHGPNYGLKDDARTPEQLKLSRETLERANRMALERECAAAGMDPDRGVSPSLVKVLRERGVIPAPQSEAAE
jgi:hypothetical protein